MSKLIYGLLALCLAAPAAADDKGKADPGPPLIQRDYVDDLSDNLDLSPEQKKKISSDLDPARDSLKRRWQRVQGLKKRIKEEGEAMQQAMREAAEKVRGHLTLEQKEKFDMMRMQQRMRMQKMRGMRGGPGGPPPGKGRRRNRREPVDFPPERYEDGRGEDRDLPPELREHMERRLRRRGGDRGRQRDVPPADEWHEGERRRPRPGDEDERKIDTRPPPPIDENMPWEQRERE